MLSWRSLTRAKGLLIEQAEKLGEPPGDPRLLFSVLYGAWVASVFASSCDVHCELAAHFLALAEQQGSITAVMIGHRLMGTSLVLTGTLVEGRAHLDRALALYDPVQHQPLAMRFGQDVAVANNPQQSWGFEGEPPEAVIKDFGTRWDFMRTRASGHQLSFLDAPGVQCSSAAGSAPIAPSCGTSA